ncbi:MAG: acylphosphatase [Acidimicrobiales bacterium]
MTSRRRVVVHGRVQGVGFRFACARRAADRSLGGRVRNLADGTVEAVFEGHPAAVDEMTAWCGNGPTMARVTRVETFEEAPVGETEFVVA